VLRCRGLRSLSEFPKHRLERGREFVGRAGLCENPDSSKATAATIRSHTGTNGIVAASTANWPNDARRTAADSVARPGWSNERWSGCIDFGVSIYGTNGVLAFTKGC
jgi:hypothetical protein